MKKLVAIFMILSIPLGSCSTTAKMRRIEKKAFHQKQSKEDKKKEKQNKKIYKYSKF